MSDQPAEAKQYDVEVPGPSGTKTRKVIADGYTWAQGGIVSFQRSKATTGTLLDGGTVTELETFATLYGVTAVYETGTVE